MESEEEEGMREGWRRVILNHFNTPMSTFFYFISQSYHCSFKPN